MFHLPEINSVNFALSMSNESGTANKIPQRFTFKVGNTFNYFSISQSNNTPFTLTNMFIENAFLLHDTHKKDIKSQNAY